MANGFTNYNATGMGAGGAADLGLLGGQLADQVQGETEEERRKRLLLQGGLSSIFGRQQTGAGSIFGSGSGRGGFASRLFGSYGR